MKRVLLSIGAAACLAGFTASAQAEELAQFRIVDEIEIPESLTGKPGDPVRGKKLAIGRKDGNCLACHRMPIPEEDDHGLTGPDLSGVGSRMSAGELRLRMVDPKVVNPATMMPAFYKVDGLHRVMDKFQGKTMLTAQEIEDIVAYLVTLKDE